jgi:EmrB/QacA subfamily drug resistance transporter
MDYLLAVAQVESVRRRWTLAAMTASLTLVFLDQTAVSVALPPIRDSLGGTDQQLAWVVNAFLLTLAAFAAVGGRLGDLLGRSRVLLLGVTVFTLASMACGLAPSVDWLIAMRAVQGIGAAAMMPVTTAIVAETSPKEQRGRAFGIYLGVASLFLSIGPLIGGALSQLASWRWIFFVNVPIAAATIAVVYRHVRPAQPPHAQLERRSLDLRGGVLLVLGLGAVVLALMQGEKWGWTAPATMVLLGGGVVSLALFGFVESRQHAPLLPLGLLRDREYLGAGFVVVCTRFVSVGAIVLSAIYLQDALGLNPLQAGLAMLPATLPMLLIAPTGGILTDRIGPRASTVAGMVMLVVSLLALGMLAPNVQYSWLVPGLVVFGTGVGLVTVSTSTAGMRDARTEELGEAAGLLATARQVGGTLGLAVMTAVYSAVASGSATPESIGSGLGAALLVAAGLSATGTIAAQLCLSGRVSGAAASPDPA